MPEETNKVEHYSEEHVRALVLEAINLTCTNEREEDEDVQRLWKIICDLSGQIAYRDGRIDSLQRSLDIYRPRTPSQ